jgi:hypothetical protein
MAGIQQDIDIFINKAQKKIANLSHEIRDFGKAGKCYDEKVDILSELDAAVDLFQHEDYDLTNNEAYEVISYLNKKAELSSIPFQFFDSNCLVENVILAGGYFLGPEGPQGPQGIQGEQGEPGDDGAPGEDGVDGEDGWSPNYALVEDGDRLVVKITGWSGGTGTPPDSDVYIGENGLVVDIADAVNMKGNPGEQGEQGEEGEQGNDGESAYVYIGYASDANGTGFTLAYNENLDYIAIRATNVEISSPVAADFAGLWKNYKGPKGDPYQIDAQGSLSDREEYDNEDEGFTFLDLDEGDIYIKKSAYPGDWAGPFPFVGHKGWSAELAVVADGDRYVLQIVDWHGGEGEKPSAISQYIGPLGIVGTAAEAVNIRGEQGQRFFPDEQGLAADRDDFDDEDAEFVYYATDTGEVSIKLSDAEADWSEWFAWIGPQGPQGPVGESGNGFNDDCEVATTADLDAAYSSGTLTGNSNGAIDVDGESPVVNDRILVKDQTNASENGIYKVTTVGNISTPFVLTRDDDFNTTLEAKKFAGVFILSGTVNSDKFFGLDTDRSGLILDTTNLSFEEIKGWIASDEAYGASWNGSILPPTKNAVYDKIESLFNEEASFNKRVLTKVTSIPSDDIDWELANDFYKELDDDYTFTFSNLEDQTINVTLTQDGTGGWTVTWPGSVVWQDGITPVQTPTIDKTDIYTFKRINGIIYGAVSQNY